jgi:DNA polymerase-1
MIAYRNAAAIEAPAFAWGDGVATENPTDPAIAKARIDAQIESLMATLRGDSYLVALSDDDRNCFRRKVLPTYKDNRKAKVRPACLGELKRHLLDNHKAVLRPGLEADDIMGIRATRPQIGKWDHETRVIVTIDKDLRQIPGVFYNPFPHGREPREETISALEADLWWMTQTLTGDDIDGYKGCPGIGPVKAKAILDTDAFRQSMDFGCLWGAVVQTFVQRGLTAADALVQARVSRILRHGDWSPETGVKLWQP